MQAVGARENVQLKFACKRVSLFAPKFQNPMFGQRSLVGNAEPGLERPQAGTTAEHAVKKAMFSHVLPMVFASGMSGAPWTEAQWTHRRTDGVRLDKLLKTVTGPATADSHLESRCSQPQLLLPLSFP